MGATGVCAMAASEKAAMRPRESRRSFKRIYLADATLVSSHSWSGTADALTGFGANMPRGGPMGLPGTPSRVMLGGTLSMTTVLRPMTALSPTLIFPTILAPAWIFTLSPISGRSVSFEYPMTTWLPIQQLAPMRAAEMQVYSPCWTNSPGPMLGDSILRVASRGHIQRIGHPNLPTR